MTCRIIRFCLAVVFVSSAALAQDFWAKKEYTQWTDEEIRKLMTNSPWAKDVSISTVPPGGGSFDIGTPAAGTSRGSEEEGGEIVTSGGTSEIGERAGRGGRGGRADGAIGASIKLIISWRSALPLKQAMLKPRIDAGGDLAADATRILSREETDYVIVVSGLPARMARAAQNPNELKKSALRRGKKPPIAPINADFQPHGQTTDVIVVFPRSDAITIDDKEVEVVVKLGPLEAKKKFTLKEMVFNGKLEL